jgi:NTP pyrophosphatase (non-canonical NTP hydrolase)
MSDFKEITKKIRKFTDDRDWMQFHDHKSMAVPVVLEAAELLEHFQLKNKGEIEEYARTHKEELGEETADICLYLFELADNLGVDLKEAIEDKLEKNDKKYPVEKAKGSAKKYNQL